MTNALGFLTFKKVCILFPFNIYLHIILQMILLISCIFCMLHTTNARKLGDHTKRNPSHKRIQFSSLLCN